jgi:prepilin-type N-terminal cleavage/methylation domain-containing protein
MRSAPTFWSPRGNSLMEVLVAILLLSLLMAAGYTSLFSQFRAYASQSMVSESLSDERTALRVMADQIWMAGYGVPTASTPSKAAELITATPTQLSFWSKSNAVHTYLTANALKNATSVTVLSNTGLKVGTSVYITDTTNWYFGTVQSVTGTSATVTPALTYAFLAGSQLTPVEQVTFTLVGNQLQRNGHRFIGNVTGLAFTYDSATLSAIRVITVQLTVQTRAAKPGTGTRVATTMTTRIAPPNLGL